MAEKAPRQLGGRPAPSPRFRKGRKEEQYFFLCIIKNVPLAPHPLVPARARRSQPPAPVRRFALPGRCSPFSPPARTTTPPPPPGPARWGNLSPGARWTRSGGTSHRGGTRPGWRWGTAQTGAPLVCRGSTLRAPACPPAARCTCPARARLDHSCSTRQPPPACWDSRPPCAEKRGEGRGWVSEWIGERVRMSTSHLLRPPDTHPPRVAHMAHNLLPAQRGVHPVQRAVFPGVRARVAQPARLKRAGLVFVPRRRRPAGGQQAAHRVRHRHRLAVGHPDDHRQAVPGEGFRPLARRGRLFRSRRGRLISAGAFGGGGGGVRLGDARAFGGRRCRRCRLLLLSCSPFFPFLPFRRLFGGARSVRVVDRVSGCYGGGGSRGPRRGTRRLVAAGHLEALLQAAKIEREFLVCKTNHTHVQVHIVR